MLQLNLVTIHTEIIRLQSLSQDSEHISALKHHWHLMVDLYHMHIKPDKTNIFIRTQACLKGMKSWMTLNFLVLASNKNEVVDHSGSDHTRFRPLLAHINGTDVC